MSKKNAALTMVALVLCLLTVNVVALPQAAYFLNQMANINTWVQLGQTLGNALAQAFNISFLSLIGILVGVA